VSGGPVCLLQSETVVQTKRRHFIVFMQKNSTQFLEPFWQPQSGFLHPAILNKEKTLAMRLPITVSDKHLLCV